MSIQKYESDYSKLKRKNNKNELLYKCIYRLQNNINNSGKCCFGKKKFLKIKINKILSKIKNVSIKIKWIDFIIDKKRNIN